MVPRRVSLVYLLCQVAMGWIQHSSTCYHVRVGSYGYVPSCQAPKATASQGPVTGNAYPLLKAPGMLD
jgi:hypothetical protein